MNEAENLEVGSVIDYIFKRNGGVYTGTILYLDEEKIKLSGPPPPKNDYKARQRKHKNRGSWYWLNEIKILR